MIAAVVAFGVAVEAWAAAGQQAPARPQPATQAAEPTSPCKSKSQSDLDGVRIEISGERCVWSVGEARAGIRIPYRLVIEKATKGVTPEPLDDGRCTRPGPGRLILFEQLGDSQHRYCLCDGGLCPYRPTAVTLKPGTYPAVFYWDGLNWTGPSDTGNPKGKPFPPGTYNLTIVARGRTAAGKTKAPFLVLASLEITLTP